MHFDNAFAAGEQGFLEGLKKYDPNNSASLGYYVYYYIVDGIQSAARQETGQSKETYRHIGLIHQWKSAFVGSEQKDPTRDELRQVLLANCTKIPVVSLDRKLDEYYKPRPISSDKALADDDTRDLYDTMPDVTANTENAALQTVDPEAIFAAVDLAIRSHLTPEEVYAFKSSLDNVAMEDIAHALGKDPKEIKMLLTSAVTKLRSSQELEAYRPQENPAQEVSEKTNQQEEPIPTEQGEPIIVFDSSTRDGFEGLDEQLSQLRTAKAKVLLLARAGLSNQAIVEKLGSNKSKVGAYISILRREGKLLPKVELFELHQETIIKLHNEFKNQIEIATAIGIHERTLKGYLHELTRQGILISHKQQYAQLRKDSRSDMTDRVKQYFEDHPLPLLRKKSSKRKEPDA